MNYIYLKKDFIDGLLPKENIALFQLIRIYSLLSSKMTMIASYGKLPDGFRITIAEAIEFYFSVIADYKTGIQKYIESIHDDICLRIKSKVLLNEVSNMVAFFRDRAIVKNGKSNYFVGNQALEDIAIIRNKIVAHLNDDFFKNIEDIPTPNGDTLVGITLDGKISTTRYVINASAITAVFAKRNNSLNTSFDIIGWLMKEIMTPYVIPHYYVLENVLSDIISEHLYIGE